MLRDPRLLEFVGLRIFSLIKGLRAFLFWLSLSGLWVVRLCGLHGRVKARGLQTFRLKTTHSAAAAFKFTVVDSVMSSAGLTLPDSRLRERLALPGCEKYLCRVIWRQCSADSQCQ